MTGTGGADPGPVAIVTGASSGLGRATAVRLARDGLRVALLARDAGVLSELERSIEESGGSALSRPVDLADASAAQAAVDHVISVWGRADALINAAATDVPGPVEETTVSDWDRVLDVNLRAPFLLSKAVFAHMRRVGGGTIVNVSSVAGLRGWANAAAYCSSKFALTGFTQALAAEGKPHGIRACVLYPGAMATSWGAWDAEERRAADGAQAQQPDVDALPADQIAELIAWIIAAPKGLVLDQVTVTPLNEKGWP
ncbi:NADP-dependent 3-hydroxy acid dehydrogenase YdfG [Blastococcus colisei]|uniref:NADP-dependent 3-hydroxy acid dehydrogenase YdfG n=1 Tax=Blastococcus colisei TaxID=1564162 RepID=A0A543PFL0_9ACTN|nr:SDR family oxidoreductase [Blastococcus colisei]TQN42865.1 NADP-dependent 3-hydroxy acid dehydrogenase YdfG [Blastococcus colisei]